MKILRYERRDGGEKASEVGIEDAGLESPGVEPKERCGSGR